MSIHVTWRLIVVSDDIYMKPKTCPMKTMHFLQTNESHVQYFYDGVSYSAVEEGCGLESVIS